MDFLKTSSHIVFVILILALAGVVSLVTTLFFSQPKTTTVYVERPGWNYRRWWGHYGAGLPGWGGPKYPPPPSPHPKPPKPSQPPTPPK